MGTFAPHVNAAHLIKDIGNNGSDFLSKVDSFYLANAIDSNFGQNLANQIINNSALDSNVERYRLKHGHITSLKAVNLASKMQNKGMQLIYSFESLTAIPNFSRNQMVKKRRDDDTELDEAEVNGMTRESYFVDEAKELIWNIMERSSKDSKIDKDLFDKYAFTSRFKYRSALHNGMFKDELLPATFKNKKKEELQIARDQLGDLNPNKESYNKAESVGEKIKFITKANTSLPADGAVALLTANNIIKGVKKDPIAVVIGYSEVNGDPKNYIDLGVQSMQNVCKENKVDLKDVDFFEMHENHPVTILSQAKALKIDVKKVNLKGGSISIGDPIAASGARLISSACSIFNQSKLNLGLINVSSPHGMSASILIKRFEKK